MPSEIQTPDLKRIRVTDALFGHYVGMVACEMIPVQWEILNGRRGQNRCFCIDNFRIAAGLQQGEHRGVVFGDTDAYKWLEAVAYCANNGETEYLPMADELIELIGKAQQPDGYLNTYYTVCEPEQRWKNLAEGHELYSAGHMIEAAVAYYQATGKPRILEIAQKFADLICATFGRGEGQIAGYPGHQEIEVALIRLWRVTGERRYLDTAHYFIDCRGTEPNYLMQEMNDPAHHNIFPELRDYDPSYSQSHLRPAEQTTAEGHAVRAMYQCAAMADLAAALPDKELRSACKNLWNSVTQKRMYITGGIGSSSFLERFTIDYDLPNDRMYCESCASVGLMMFGRRMAALFRNASYYDQVERALYNTVLGGVSATGDRYFYVNPLEVWPENCLPHTTLDCLKPVRQPWFEVSCCPANIARTLASLGQYIYAVDEKSLYINLLIGSTIETKLRETNLRVAMENNLMHGGVLKLNVNSDGSSHVLIRLRIPGWLEQPKITLDGSEIQPAMENGYAVLAMNCGGDHEFVVTGSVPAKYLAANLQVRADVGKVAVQKGPFVYCVEQMDNGNNLAALRVDQSSAPAETAPESELPGGLPTLQLRGKRIVRTEEEEAALYSPSSLRTEDCTLKAIPYCLWNNRTPGEMRVWLEAILP